MIRLLNLGPAKHEEGVICVANQRIPNVCRIAGAACCGAIRNEIFRWHQLGATRPPDPGLLAPTYKQEQDHQDMEAIFLLTLLPFTHGGCETATVGLTTTRYNTSVQSAFLAIHLGNSACGLVFSDDTVDFL